MNNREKMEEFIQYLGKIYQQNPTLEIRNATIYHLLMNYGLTEEEQQNKDIYDLFSKWQAHFANSFHLNVYVNSKQPSFLQFSHPSSEKDCVKIYLSFPKEVMEFCVNEIFQFIESEKIDTMSKVSKILRSDSVVLRIPKLSDAEKVLSYLQSHSGLQTYMKFTNPFSVKRGKIGIAYDHFLSYNDVVSQMLVEYLQKLKNESQLKFASLSSFSLFLENYYQDTFSWCTRLSEFVDSSFFQSYSQRFLNVGAGIVNFKQVIKLLLEHTKGNLDEKQLFNYIESFKDENRLHHTENNYNEYLKNVNARNEVSQETSFISSKDTLILDYLKLGEQKYGSSFSIYLSEFVETGSYLAITREKSFRARFLAEGVTKEDMKNVLLRLGITLKLSNDGQKEFLDFHSLVVDACVATYQKYGKGQLEFALNQAIYFGKYQGFTNGDNRYRERLRREVSMELFVESFKNLLMEEGYVVEDIQFSSNYISVVASIIERYVMMGKDVLSFPPGVVR